MAFTQQEESDIRKQMSDFIDAMRPPEHIRPQLDYGYRLEGQHVFIFEIRPQWNKPEILRHSDFAKISFVRNTSVWKIYWMRGNLQWDAYEPSATGSLKAAIKLIIADKHSCFFG